MISFQQFPEMLTELLRREKQLNITPDPYIDAYLKVWKVCISENLRCAHIA